MKKKDLNKMTFQELQEDVSTMQKKKESVGKINVKDSPLVIGEKYLIRTVTMIYTGELQKVSIAACLGRKAHLYLIDEPSAFISSEDRVNVAKVIKRVVSHYEMGCLVVEHDIMMLNFFSDRLMVFDGISGIEGKAKRIARVQAGMNNFLRKMDITFRQDPRNLRPRVNKKGSQLDKKQKAEGRYFTVA